MATSYNTETIILRAQIMNTAKYEAGTYKKGQLLGRISTSGLFTVYNASYDPDEDDPTGSEIVTAVCPVDITINAVVKTGPVARGEFSRAGVAAVMASLTPAVTLTDQIIGQCWDAGIILN
jgi:hypothetical protein